MSILTANNLKHINRMFIHEQKVNRIYSQLVDDLSRLLAKWKDSGRGGVWIRNKQIEKLIDNRLEQFRNDFIKHIDGETLKSWNLSNFKNDELVDRFIENLSITKLMKDGMFKRNMDAYETFRQRKIEGMNLSDRVWDLADQMKINLEYYLESGIGAGRSAEQIARDIKHLLNDPDKVFRRVRDKNGNLVPSRPMKNYNPGPGIYRSSRMNAVRLAVTEINMAYRQADYVRWMQLDFILGFEVHRSQNHKPCVVCDALKGRYPKEFKFIGWHPFCICFATPIQLSHDDFADYLINDVSLESKMIKNIPTKAHKFFEANDKFRSNSYAGKNYRDWMKRKLSKS